MRSKVRSDLKMKMMREEGKSYKKIAESITAKTKKKFVASWVFNILKREEQKLENAIDTMVKLEVV